VEVRLGDLWDRVLDVLQILGALHGRALVAPAVWASLQRCASTGQADNVFRRERMRLDFFPSF